MFLNEFRVFSKIGARCVFDETKKEKREEGESHQEMEIAEVIVELIYIIIYDFSGARALEGGDQTVCCL